MTETVASSAPNIAADDTVTPFHVDALNIRGRVVRLGPVLDEILTRHAYPESVSRLLAEFIALTAILGSSLKFDGKFILQTQTQGPVSLLVVDFQTPNNLRAYARFDKIKVEEARIKGIDKNLDLLGTGVLVMTIDPDDNTNRYQGIVELDGNTLEEAARTYFKQSEQIPTEIRLAVAQNSVRNSNGKPTQSWRAGGMEIQFLPGSGQVPIKQDLPGDGVPEEMIESTDISMPDGWVEAKSLIATLGDIELVDPEVSSATLIHRLFNQHEYFRYSEKHLHDKCSCSREKLLTVLAGFDPDEIEQCTVNGKIVADCEFCSSSYHFDPDEIASVS